MGKYVITFSVILVSLVVYEQSIADRQPLSWLQPPDSIKTAPGKSAWTPYYIFYRVHNNGAFRTVVFNNGIIGNVYSVEDPSLQWTKAADNYHPRNGKFRHAFFTCPWIGGIIDDDTLVTTSIDCDQTGYYAKYENEFLPDYWWLSDFEDLSPPEFKEYFDGLVHSQYAFQCYYTDTAIAYYTMPYNTYDKRRHIPMNIKVTQTSYSWSYQYAEDFIIINYHIQNIGTKPIVEMYFGLYHEGAMHHVSEVPQPRLDDLEGYIDSIPYENPELGMEPLHCSWVCDVNGDPWGSVWNPISTLNCFGIAPLEVPWTVDRFNFNWWVEMHNQSWGPRQRPFEGGLPRLFYGELGIPHGDANKYYMMAYPEVDYTGYKAALDQRVFGWLPPVDFAEDIADGHFVHYVTSYGPMYIRPGASEEITVVMSVGENLHSVPSAYHDLYDFDYPQTFINYLNFDDLYTNLHWAKRIYDNPGVDTDNDGDSGKFYFVYDSLSNDSTQVYYEGDGVPDYRGAAPPPPPEVRVYPELHRIRVRWNGRYTENFFDNFSQLRDFEGYRIYFARSRIESDFVLLSTYDREDFNRYEWIAYKRKYELNDIPFTLDSLRLLYGDNFDPTRYTRTSPFFHNGNYYIFDEVAHNQSSLTDTIEIHKVYPDAVNDTTDVDENGRMRFYEYEFVIENCLPTTPYYISVTAFDFGYPAKSLEPLESNPLRNAVESFAIDSGELTINDDTLKVYVYPNPYRVDGGYQQDGFENRETYLPADKARALYFANLPPGCSTISIYSLDGDLVRKLIHDDPIGSGTASIEQFDLITRNNMAMTTGLYYWVVESDYGSQIGKLVVIK